MGKEEEGGREEEGCKGGMPAARRSAGGRQVQGPAHPVPQTPQYGTPARRSEAGKAGAGRTGGDAGGSQFHRAPTEHGPAPTICSSLVPIGDASLLLLPSAAGTGHSDGWSDGQTQGTGSTGRAAHAAGVAQRGCRAPVNLRASRCPMGRAHLVLAAPRKRPEQRAAQRATPRRWVAQLPPAGGGQKRRHRRHRAARRRPAVHGPLCRFLR